MNQILSLSLDEQRELRDRLTASIRNARLPRMDGRYGHLLNVMEMVTGQTVNPLSREPKDVWGRTMCAYQMLLEGYTTTEVGLQMGRDHSTVSWLKRKMEDALSVPAAYQDILPIWNDFKKMIQL